MTNEEERELSAFLKDIRDTVQNGSIVPGEMARAVFNLAELLLKENSALRVRDSNVTAHSLNVMSVNEDLRTQLAVINNQRCGSCKHWTLEEAICGRITDTSETASLVPGEFGPSPLLSTDNNFGCVLWEAK